MARTPSGNPYSQNPDLLERRVVMKRANKGYPVYSPELAPVQIESEHGETYWPSRGTLDDAVANDYKELYGNNTYFWADEDTAHARVEDQQERREAERQRREAVQRQEAIQTQRQEETDRYCQDGPGGCPIAGGRSKKSRRRNKKTRRHRKK